MAPPRSPDGAAGIAGSAGHATADGYDALLCQIAEVQGAINVAEAHLVALTGQALACGVSGGDNLSPSAWLAWRAGVAPGRARDIVRLAERAAELPHTLHALTVGELTLDQAAEVARYVPANYEESAAEVARCCTVRQLRQALPGSLATQTSRATPRPAWSSPTAGVVRLGQ